MNINTDYLDRVRRLAALCVRRKTSDLLEGDYASRAHGRSLDFDDLREYRPGDEVSDIDWKSSSRTGRILVRRYFAERKHDALFVCDTGRKMDADTSGGESKAHLAMMAFGVSAYLLDRQGVNYALAFRGRDRDYRSGFLSGVPHLERQLAAYQHALEGAGPDDTLPGTLERISGIYTRHMILMIVTDGEGLAALDERLVRRLVRFSDVYIFKIEDAFLSTPDIYDIQAERFEDPFLASDPGLRREELRLRDSMDRAAEQLLARHRAFFCPIAREEDIVDAFTEMFRRRKGCVSA